MYGCSFFFTAVAKDDVGPFTLAAPRLVIARVVLIAILRFTKVDGYRYPTFRQMALLRLFDGFSRSRS